MKMMNLQSISRDFPEMYHLILQQLRQPHCGRCGGTMVRETCMDLFSDYQNFQFEARHCIQCGDLVDPCILFHRLKRHTLNTFQSHSTSSQVLEIA
ncbi:hypothetical protein [Candidatus Nitrospira salsa]